MKQQSNRFKPIFILCSIASIAVSSCTTTASGISMAQNPTTIQVNPHYGREFQNAAAAVDVINRGLNPNYSAQSVRGGQALQGMGMLLDLLSR